MWRITTPEGWGASISSPPIEFETDLDIERLPSGKLETRDLVLSVAAYLGQLWVHHVTAPWLPGSNTSHGVFASSRPEPMSATRVGPMPASSAVEGPSVKPTMR